MKTEKIRPRSLPSPVELAGELRHLDGFLFFDSSSAEESASKTARFSLLTAEPELTLEGNIFDEADRESLRACLDRNSHPPAMTPDFGFPTDGLYGSVDYDGDFHFGLYRKFLLYDHSQDLWQERGDLSKSRQLSESTTARIPTPAPDIDRDRFCAMVATAQEYICAGDIYQVNLSHRFSTPIAADFDAFSLHLRLREQSPAPFAAFLSQPGRQIISSSPEQFLGISGRTIQTRPIKGTRPRFRDREKDEKSAYDLITSPKEIAELIMITDLERNDLGQICEYGSVEATELLKLERFAQVFHLVSTVRGTLRAEIDPVEAVHACFPGGSITGAPKKRAREIIDELEPVPRGLYTGAIGCFGFNGESRFNIAIRTAIAENETLHFHVGAGIVADSIPEKEWEETLHKAAGILQATS